MMSNENSQTGKVGGSKLKYVLLTLALIELAVGLSNARANVFFYLGLPLGTVLLGLYLIIQSFEKESARFDEQNRAAVLALPTGATPRQPKPVQAGGTTRSSSHHGSF
jgi:hypothetical protein